MKLRAFAKINLSLRVFGKRPDGFHDLESIMQSVSLHDIITIEPIEKGIEVTCSDSKAPKGQENIAYKAAEVFLKSGKRQEAAGIRGLRVHIEKRIPMAAGLAGGSADAAAVLYGLNRMMNAGCQMSNAELMKLGSEIGSDVPFCLVGGTCLVKGRGEIVEKQEPWPKTYFILVCPDLQISASWAYEEFDNLHISPPAEVKNDLEPVVVSKYGVVAEIKEKLLKLGCGEAQMSGSGPSVFGMVRHQAEAKNIFGKIREEYPRTFLVETVDQGVEVAG